MKGEGDEQDVGGCEYLERVPLGWDKRQNERRRRPEIGRVISMVSNPRNHSQRIQAAAIAAGFLSGARRPSSGMRRLRAGRIRPPSGTEECVAEELDLLGVSCGDEIPGFRIVEFRLMENRIEEQTATIEQLKQSGQDASKPLNRLNLLRRVLGEMRIQLGHLSPTA